MKAADEELRKRTEQRKLLAQQQLEDDTRWLMADERGRRLVWGWLTGCKVFHSTYTGEALSGAFEEGKRSRGLALLTQVMLHSPADYIRMQAEAQEPR